MIHQRGTKRIEDTALLERMTDSEASIRGKIIRLFTDNPSLCLNNEEVFDLLPKPCGRIGSVKARLTELSKDFLVTDETKLRKGECGIPLINYRIRKSAASGQLEMFG